jgi:hypothetical protein
MGENFIIEITKGTNTDCPLWKDPGPHACGIKHCPEFYDRRRKARMPRNCPAKKGILVKVKNA